FRPHRFSIPTEYPAEKISEAVKESRDVARSRRGLERTNVRDGPPAAASRKIHRRHVIERNVTKKFVSTKRQTPILGCGRTHRECRQQFLHTLSLAKRAMESPPLTPERS